MSTIAAGQQVSLQWQTSNATAVSISPSVSTSPLPMSGSITVTPTATTTYTMTVTGAGGTVTQSVTVTVTGAAPSVTFSSSANSVVAGQSVTLMWQTSNATSVSITPSVSPSALGLTDHVLVTPQQTTTYVLTATGPGGSATQSVTVTVTTQPPQVAFSASSTSITAGQPITLSWQTSNATSVGIVPSISSSVLPVTGSISGVTPQQTTTYVLTATGPGGNTSQSVIVNVAQPVQPTVGSFTATPATVNSGGLSTLSWTTTNAVSVSISPNPLDGGESGTLPLSGSTPVTPTATTQYTLTAMGAGNLTTTATATVTVTPMTLSLSVSPARVVAGQAATLTWQTSGGVTGLTIDNNACGATACTLPNGSATVQPATTTTYTATATGAGGTITQAAVVTVSKTTPGGSLKHIVFMVQENRSFDNYFGMLGPYRAQRLQPFGISAAASDVDGLNCTDANCSNITLLTRTEYPKPNAPVHPFHFTTACTENLTPSWDESHYDVHITGTNWQQTTQPGWVLDPAAFKMDNFLQTTSSITQVNPNDDPNGTRPLGYYNQADLPFYYDLATFFSTSDRWFSPILANTIPNRMYLFAGTSFGHVFPDNPPPGGFSPQTIFAALTKAGVSWRYYYLDNSVFLSQFKDYQSNPIIAGNVYPIQDYYNILQGMCSGQPCDPDQALPQVIFIERAGSTGLDEHPDTGSNNQKGAAVVQQIVEALMNSTAWSDSAFIFTFDEAGGFYDHVPPIQEPLPDNYAPGQCPDTGACTFGPSDMQATFNTSGLRLPLIVISPWAKPHYVSHTPRDTTAILAFIEETFNVPPLTSRDAYYGVPARDMSEFFDFTTPALLNAPDGSAWSAFLPQQPTNLPCTPSLGKAPGY